MYSLDAQGQQYLEESCSTWSFSSSGVSFEQTGGFGLPADIDRSFDRLVSALTAAVATWSTPAPEHP